MAKVRVVIVPGNGGGDVERSNWYGWLRKKLTEKDVDCALKNMPDPVIAREAKWIPFMEEQLHCDSNTVIVGHSSGAEAALRYAENHSVHGLVLVSACVTDLGEANEKASGYYNRPWEWEQIRQNTQWIIQFGSTDDPFVPFSEQKQVAEGTAAEFHQFSDKGHFMSMAFPELVNKLMNKLQQS
ncbi:Putative hydrolase rbbp9 [Desmophyllum pertusum]|uniref:Hydrolase rbbp9 n=1 Tax=Desmophyllum pertusum TaxID=174260 RepID=A0A9W9Z179_9CNID|nr:Putative hydrolase rbbp9 [Desmophyllum pertusum]